MANKQVRLENDVAAIVKRIVKLAEALGQGNLSDARAAGWLIREGGRALLPKLEKQAKEKR